MDKKKREETRTRIKNNDKQKMFKTYHEGLNKTISRKSKKRLNKKIKMLKSK